MRTHSAAKDRCRDDLTKAAGYQTNRFQSKQKPTEAEIAVNAQSTACISFYVRLVMRLAVDT